MNPDVNNVTTPPPKYKNVPYSMEMRFPEL